MPSNCIDYQGGFADREVGKHYLHRANCNESGNFSLFVKSCRGRVTLGRKDGFAALWLLRSVSQKISSREFYPDLGFSSISIGLKTVKRNWNRDPLDCEMDGLPE